MTPKKIFSMLVLCGCLLGCAETVSAQKRKTPPRRKEIVRAVESPAESNPELQRRVEAFLVVWQTIRDNYFDRTYSGLDWDKIKREYEPRVAQTTNDGQLHDILQEMINRLNRSHFAIIPPEVYQAIEKAKIEAKAREKALAKENEKTNGDEEAAALDEDAEDDAETDAAKYGIGVDLRLMDNRFVITRVDKNSTAERAGLKIGYVVEKINDVSLAELLGKIEVYYAKVRNFKRHLPAEISSLLLNGEKDSTVALVCLDGDERPLEFKIEREALKGETVSIGKNFPEQYLRFETVSLNDEVGLIRFNLFAIPVIEKFCAALTDLKDKKAVIIDLRGNTGGILGSLVGLGGMLTEKSIDLGTSVYKIGSENFTALSKAKNYKGKIVFLVDNQTVSAAEIFAAALQENNRAVVVGETTAGEALPAVSMVLPTGAVLYYPIANFKTRNGNYLEGRGVQPNLKVSLDRPTLLAGTDAQIAAALKIIKENTAFPKPNESAPTEKIRAAAPPPPAPKLKQLGVVTVKAPPPPPEPPPYAKKDEKAVQAISDFINAVGGIESFEKINSYSLKGRAELAVRGVTTDVEMQAFRQKPDKYSEIWGSSAIGEVRQVYNGKQTFVQSDYGMMQDIAIVADTANVEMFAAFNDLLKKDRFKSLKYEGVFDRQNRKTQLVEAVTQEGATVALAFDVETKLLSSYAFEYYTISFGDYRKVADVMLPFTLEREGFMNIRFDEIKINTAVEESVFTKKVNCYDRAN